MKPISLSAWLDAYVEQKSLNADHQVICFHGGSEYPLLFFMLLSRVFASNNQVIQALDASVLEWPAIQGTITTSFLGQSLLYHIKGLHLLDAKKSKKILPNLFSYKGPHQLIIWLSDDMSADDMQGIRITMPTKIDHALIVSLARTFGFSRLITAQKFLKSISAKASSLSLELICLLFSYGMVLGSDIQSFNEQWFDHLLDEPPSLFALSQHFFSRDVPAFYAAWQQLKDRYQIPFWMTYWSEQLFRAACFLRYHQSQNTVAMKKIGFRLPFAFLSSGPKNYSYNELMHAHNAIYAHDVHFKNGGSEEMIELFYTQFFSGQFKRV